MNRFLLYISILFTTSLFAKKVKFAVDMTGQTISAFGVHVCGDFQVLAGYPTDWDYASTLLTQEGSSNIYSIVVNIPAFKKYEFKFINGDQGYESEYVPDEVRVGYDFDDNRWMYVDSLSNDTSFIGAVQFGLSSPAGKYALRYKVDASSLTVSADGMHTATDYNSFSSVKNTMVTFTANPSPNIYEVINYVDAGTYHFNFINGNTLVNKEPSVPGACSNSGVRYITVSKDTVFPDVCYNYCVPCSMTGVKEITANQNKFNLFPNPAKSSITVFSSNQMINTIEIYTVAGQLQLQEKSILSNHYLINNLNLSKGIYFVKVSDSNNQSQNIKLIID